MSARSEKRPGPVGGLLIFVACIAAILWAGWRWNEAIYGDGRCMFARCVRVVP